MGVALFVCSLTSAGCLQCARVCVHARVCVCLCVNFFFTFLLAECLKPKCSRLRHTAEFSFLGNQRNRWSVVIWDKVRL